MIFFRGEQKWIIFVTLFFTTFLQIVSGNNVCLQCTNIPHPWDCNRAIQCNTHESCYVEQVVTISGIIVYNSGCASEQRCKAGASLAGKRSVIYSKDINQQVNSFDERRDGHDHRVIESPIEEVSVYEELEADLTTCLKCCNTTNYCNQNLCDTTPQPAHPNQTYCLSCSDVVNPSDCEYFVLCDVGELCYTEYINLNGQDRYRMGCIASTACADTMSSNPSPAFVGKKRFVADDQMAMEKYCSKCCRDNVGNCNRELCDKANSVPSGIDVLELITPPERQDFCADLFPDSCKIVILQSPELCKDPRYSTYACREFCGTCVNPGHNTAQPPTTVQGGGTAIPITPTKSVTPTLPPTDCFYDSNKYMGAYATSVTGKPCLVWSKLDPTLTGFPDESIDDISNKCRDPDKRGFPWCYTSDSYDWEFCPVPYCQECFYANQSTQYEGYVNVDTDNNTCQPWTNYVAQTGDTNVKFPNNSVADAKNYCRDPKESGTPQCYNGVDLKPCDISQCPHECQDDPQTNCALVQKFVCKSEYTSTTLCPKTCNMCKFGLLPPVKKDPPADICVDNPDANCAILQSIICSDPDGALKLCPKTCQKCNILYGHSTNIPSTSPITSPTSAPQMTSSSTPATNPTQTDTVTTGNTQSTAVMTSSTPTSTLPSTQAPTPYWLPWGSWICEQQSGACFQNRFRNCSTGNDNDCKLSEGGVNYNIGLCNETSCPGFTTASTIPPSTTTKDPCQDDPTSVGCNIPGILTEVCKEKAAAWKLCRRSCGLCDTCWDYLNCNSTGAQTLFCKRDSYALQYCRKTCGKCDHKPVDVVLNQCGDPVSSEGTCETLQNEICICNDPDLRALCGQYCDNKCKVYGYPYTGSNCKPARRKKRELILNRVMLN